MWFCELDAENPLFHQNQLRELQTKEVQTKEVQTKEVQRW